MNKKDIDKALKKKAKESRKRKAAMRAYEQQIVEKAIRTQQRATKKAYSRNNWNREIPTLTALFIILGFTLIMISILLYSNGIPLSTIIQRLFQN